MPGTSPTPSGAALVRTVSRRLNRLSWVGGATGSVVAFCVVGFLIPIVLDPSEHERLGLINAPVLVVYFLVAASVGTWLSNRRFRDALAWLVEERAPSEREHRLTLSLAVDGAKLNAASWVLGGVVFFAVNAVAESWEFAAFVAATAWVGGETACALDYLMSERILRPVTARALAARRPATRIGLGVRSRLAMAWALGTGVPLLGVLVVAAVGLYQARRRDRLPRRRGAVPRRRGLRRRPARHLLRGGCDRRPPDGGARGPGAGRAR